jgi:hypothetical protein
MLAFGGRPSSLVRMDSHIVRLRLQAPNKFAGVVSDCLAHDLVIADAGLCRGAQMR